MNNTFKFLKDLKKSPYYPFLSSDVKSAINLIEDLFPEKKAETPEVEKTDLEKAEELARKKAIQADVSGISTGNVYDFLEKYGFLPKDWAKKNIWGRLQSSVTFPLQKIMSAGMAFPRALSTFAVEQTKALSREKWGEQATPSDIFKIIKHMPSSYKASAKAFFNMPGSIQNWAQAQKEIFPDTWYTKQFEFAKEWGKETAPWYKKIVSGLAGSPADITGFILDIVTDPLTYLTAGVGTGARTGIKLAKPLVAKGGKVILPKGAMLGLSKMGRKTIKEGVEEALPRIMSFVKKITSKPKPLTKTAQLLKEIPSDILQKAVRKKVTETTLRNVIKNLPYEKATKLIDFGGLKFAGKTVIPGYKFAKVTEPITSTLEKRPIVRALEGLFWTRRGLPEELRPIRTLVKSQMRHRFEEGSQLLQNIFKNLNKTEIDNVGDYLWLASEIARLQSKGKKIPVKLITKLDDLTKKLNLKQLEAINKYQKEFVKDFLYKFEKEIGVKYPELALYYPSRYEREILGRGKYEIGMATAPFEKGKKLSYRQAQKLIAEGKLKPKDVIEASLQRLYEHTSRSGRQLFLQEAKQFARPVKTPGMVKVTGIKELKGWYMPEKYIEPLKRMYKAFYGDEAFKYTMKLWDKGINVWKKLALFTPGYHFRNFWTDLISGMMEYGLKFLNPRYWDEALKIQMQKHVPIKSLGGMYGDEAYKLLLKNGIKSGGFYAEEAGRGAFKSALAKWTPFAISRRAGIAREDLGRIVLALMEKEAGSSWDDIVEQVGKVFFHYWDITPFERNVMRRFINPFYTWTRKNIARQVELLFTRTGAYMTIPKVANFVENMSKIPEGYMHYKPEYFADLFAIMTPFRTLDGVPLALNPNFAWQDWSRLSLKDIASSLNPLLKIPIELIGNREIFFNKPIRQGKYVEAPKELSWAKKIPEEILENFGMKVGKDNKLYIKDIALYLYRQNPLFYNLMRFYPSTDKPKTPYDRLSLLVGIKFFPYEEDKARQYYFQRFIDEVNKRISEQKSLGYETPTIPQMESAYKKMYKDVIGKKYNIDELNKLLDLLSMARGTSKERQYISMLKQPYKEEVSKATGANLIELNKLLESLNIKPNYEDIRMMVGGQ